MIFTKILLVILTFIVCAQSLDNTDSFVEFKQWTDQYNKIYETSYEEMHRFNIWLENSAFIEQTNKLGNGYVLEVNEFADVTWDEFRKTKMGLGYVHNKEIVYDDETLLNELPTYVNWTAAGVVTEVKNQFSCGSCWAFSTTGAIESMHAIKTGELVSLSEENLIDCSFKYGNGGCMGGWPSYAMNYVAANKGIDTEASYPLTSVFMLQCIMADTCPCRFNRSAVGATISGYNQIISGNETDLQYAIAFIGPISVCIDTTPSFQFYSSGVFSDTNCSSTLLDHAVLAVGYGTTVNGTDYYIVKNSWGENWGMNGYVLMARNKRNMCGIATSAIYPIV